MKERGNDVILGLKFSKIQIIELAVGHGEDFGYYSESNGKP